MGELKPGAIVKVGFGTAEIIRECRKYGQDGYIVQPLRSRNGHGAVRRGYPGWVPASNVVPIENES